MSLTKHATFQVLAAQYATAGSPRLRVQGHKAEFEYDPRPGYLYVRSRAISSRTNDNFDDFPAEELKKGYRSFLGKPTFVNHHNSDHRRARGVIVAVALHEDVNPDGTPDTWVECLHEVDAIHFPKLAEAIVKGRIACTSMGVDVAYSVCSVCGNKAASPLEYCRHIPSLKGQRIYKTDQKTGAKTGVLVYESCYGLSFFENSLLVEEPADPTAFVLGTPVLGAGVAEALGVRTSALTQPAAPNHTRPDPTLPASADHQRTVKTAGATFFGPGDKKRLGRCYELSGKKAGFTSGSVLVHGSIQGYDHAPIGHAWVVLPSGEVWEPATDTAYDADAFQRLFNPTPIVTYTSTEARAKMVETMNFGPWDERAMVDTKVSASSKTALLPGEVEVKTVAPTKIDTLRDTSCPVCGEGDAWNGEACQVCGFIAPPDAFGDPDTELAQKIDLRDDTPGGGTLKCDSCGATFPVAPSAHTALILSEDPDGEETSEATDGGGDGFLSAGSASTTDPQFLPAGSAGSTVASRRRVSKVASRVGATRQKEDSMPRPALAALAEQQRLLMAQHQQIVALRSAVAFIAKAAGIETHPIMRQALRVVADSPGSPVGWAITSEDPSGSAAAVQPSGDVSSATATDDPTQIGASPLTDVSADAKTDPTQIGGVIDVPAAAQTDVTTPVSGTNG